ncbi:helicase C-terminal domain-containing protein [Pelagophyceae sp. CCMP2097]|nr:helicase C-terminal domain-containing protein [Pelagophyceae sp. CCMP2097]
MLQYESDDDGLACRPTVQPAAPAPAAADWLGAMGQKAEAKQAQRAAPKKGADPRQRAPKREPAAKKEPVDAKGQQQRRRERRERDAKARSGELSLPMPVIDFDAKKAATLTRLVREGVECFSLRPPYRSQLQVVDCALRALAQRRSALIESPTGTGKTAAALMAALAWQRANASTPTRVVWVARTHDQLVHAVHEYERGCAERPLMSLRLSRERFCLHPDIATAPNKAEACEEATKVTKAAKAVSKAAGAKQSGCGHLDKAEKIGYPQSQRWRPHFRVGGAMNVWDIEDAVKEGQKTHVCPFHMAQDQIQEGAALIFITYQQLVEPIVRRAGGLDQVLEDAVVIVDEAHNLAQVSRDAASYDVTEQRLAALVATLRDFVPHLHAHKEAQQMIESLVAPPASPGTLPAGAAPSRTRPAGAAPFNATSVAQESVAQEASDDDDDVPISVFRAFKAKNAQAAAASPAKKKRKTAKKPTLLFAATPRGGPLVALLSWLRGATLGGDVSPLPEAAAKAKDGGATTERQWPGFAAAMLLKEVVGLVSADRVDDNCKILWKLRKTLIDEGLESGAVRSETINDLECILVKLRYLLDDSAAAHYRLIATKRPRKRDSAPKGPAAKKRDFAKKQQEAEVRRAACGCDERHDLSLTFACLRASVAMAALTRGQRAAGLGKATFLRPVRSLLLLSGTLRPFDLLADELGLDLQPPTQPLTKAQERTRVVAPDIETAVEDLPFFAHSRADGAPEGDRREADAVPASEAFAAHGVAAAHLPGVQTKLLPLQLSRAMNVPLDASYRNATAAPSSSGARAYFDALAYALHVIATTAPRGLLVFFKSYKLLDLALERWAEPSGGSSWLARLEAAKPVYVEKSSLRGDEFDAVCKAYRADAEASVRGAMLLGVMRGRAAEGADFRDDAARVVAIVGLPFPPRLEATIELKIDHDNKLRKDSGESWYKAEAYRNINQAAGRLIRHSNDFGALVLLDKALGKHPMMSEWYGASLEHLDGATVLHQKLKAFFEAKNAFSERDS